MSASHSHESLDWNGLLQAIRADHPELYRSWFEALEPGQLRGGELHVHVPNPSWADHLRAHCAQAFAHSVTNLTGHLVAVRFTAPGDADLAGQHWIGRGLTSMPLNPDYMFSEFVVGLSNRLAHAACSAACNQPGTLYNPLFIHGASGLGKTHLLQGACMEMLRLHASAQVIYVSCETFINDHVRAIASGELQTFRDSARRSDVLVIDDIQFLTKHEASQEELFHTFNTLYQSRRQIILSADSPPTAIPALEDRLVSRFKWGLVAQIDPPNREMRQAILQKKAHLRGCDVPGDVLDYIAEHVESNIRVLEGTLTKLITEAQLNGKPLNLDTARAILSIENLPQHPLQVSEILQVVSKHFGVRLQELLGRRRTRSVRYPRHVAMYLARKLTSLSLEEIGAHFDGRDHSTILHGEQTIEQQRRADPQTAETIALLTRQLLARQ